jgi:hypothetical protein
LDLIKLVSSVPSTTKREALKLNIRRLGPVPGKHKTWFTAYPQFVEKFRKMTVGGVPMFTPDGRMNPELYMGGKPYDDGPSSPKRRRAA